MGRWRVCVANYQFSRNAPSRFNAPKLSFQMIQVISANTRHEAWIEAMKFLLEQDSGYALNLVLSIKDPLTASKEEKGANKRLDAFYAEQDKYSMHTIAETIFPGWLYRKKGIQGVYEIYPEEEYPLIKRHSGITWGTYAYRMLRRPTKSGITNPLHDLITKMRSEIAQPGPKRSCYEIGIGEGVYDIPLHITGHDDGRRLGGPCLSHLSFKLISSTVHLTAMYRSHDYLFKVPGNLLGLSRLLSCVARETGGKVGELVVHSTYARVNLTSFTGGTRRIKEIVKDCSQEEQVVQC